MKKVLILESNRDQAKTIISYLRKYTDYQLSFEKNVSYEGTETFDLVIPTGATSTLLYVQKHGAFKIGEIEYSENNLLTYDKIKNLDLVKQIGVPIPDTYLHKEDMDFFPIFYKSLREEGYNERGIIHNSSELKKLKSTTVFFQEFINTPGTYAVGFIADRGKILTTFSQEEIISVPKHGGSGVVLRQIDDKRLINHTTRIIEAVNYSGWGLVEYKYCNKRNDYVFMEVNGKFWASIEFALINNSDFMRILFGINYVPRNVNTVIYVDRVAASEFSEIRKSIPFLFSSKWLRKQSITKTIYNRIFSK